MKKNLTVFFKYIFLLVVLIPNFIHAQQQWYPSFVPRGRHVNDIKIIDTTRIVISGGNESNDSLIDIFLSRNGGLFWDFSYNAIAPWIKSTALKDSMTGFAVGYSGTIFKTVNGCVSWTKMPVPINRQFNKIIYSSATTLFIAGGTKPGVDADTLQTILKSTDGGATWTVKLDQKGYWLRSISFADALNGLAVGDSGVILRTTDGGNSWTKITPPVRRNFNGVKFINSTKAILCGGDMTNATILSSANGGMSWSIIRDTAGGILNDVFSLNDSICYIVGDRSTFLKSRNGGNTWKADTIDHSNLNQTFNSVFFKKESFGVIGGQFGVLYIFTHIGSPAVSTSGAIVTTDTTATLKAVINTHGYFGLYSFLYSIDSTFASYAETYPEPILSNSYLPVQFIAYDLFRDTTYYFTIKAWTLSDTVYGDTLHFFSHPPRYSYQTLSPINTTSTGATLSGYINKFTRPVSLSFEYGITPALGNEVAAIPPNVNDSLLHSITAVLSNLQSNKTYYYRLKVNTGVEILLGETLTFFTGTVFKTVQTLYPTNVQNQSATLNGAIDKFLLPVNLKFEYGISPALGTIVSASPFTVNDTLYHTCSSVITNLTPATQYYYRLIAECTTGTYYGEMISFNSDINYTLFNTLAATGITSSGSTLNGVANKLSAPLNISFQYDTTASFTHPVLTDAIPNLIDDTLLHYVSAAINGLDNNRLYYFRLKGTDGSVTIYGDTYQFFTGYPEIPNWDFQDWDIDTVHILRYWNVGLDSFSRVPGYSGNYALKLSGQTFALNGFPDDRLGFLGGYPFVGHPDSVAAYLNYSIEPGDSAFMLVFLKKEGQMISNNIIPITGNSGGLFKRFAHKLDYTSSLTADSIIVGTASTNLFSGKSSFKNNSLIIDDITLNPGRLTFANSDFEEWFPQVIESPRGWFSLKYIGLNDNPSSKHMVSKAYFNIPDDYAAEINTISINTFRMAGNLSIKSFIDDNSGGFPVRGRHVSLNGYYKYIPAAGDTMEITIQMKKNGQNIGGGSFISYDSTPGFIPFTVPIFYNYDLYPDSAIISISNSKKKTLDAGNSILLVDKLSFDGFYTGISQHTSPDLLELDGMKVFPNPARDMLMIETQPDNPNDCSLTLLGITGQIIRETKLNTGQRISQLEVGDIAPGIYLLVLRKGEHTYTKKIVIQQ